MKTLSGKRTLITGAGQGLGRELAKVFAAAGADVVVTDIEADRVAETTGILHRLGYQAIGFAMDVSDPNSIWSVRDRLHKKHGQIDVLINNAGVVNGGAFLDVSLDDHLNTYEVNTLGLVAVTHVFLPDLILQPEAHCVNVSSAAGLLPLPHGASYASSKWAVIGFTQSIREELRLAGNAHVKLTTVCPSYIDTGLFEGVRSPLFSRMLKPERLAKLVLKAVQRDREMLLTPWLVKLLPLGRVLLPRSWSRRLIDWFGVTTGMLTWKGRDGKTDQLETAQVKKGSKKASEWARKVASL